MTKTCSKCKFKLDYSNFTKDSQKFDGLRPSCKKCNSKAKPIEILHEDFKKCTKCKKVKLKSDFNFDATKSTGYYSSCKSCISAKYGRKQKRSKGETYIDSNGYICLARNKKRREHRIIMENILGKKLNRDEHVHHINGNKTDNRIKNLTILSASEHHQLHHRMKKIF